MRLYAALKSGSFMRCSRITADGFPDQFPPNGEIAGIAAEHHPRQIRPTANYGNKPLVKQGFIFVYRIWTSPPLASIAFLEAVYEELKEAATVSLGKVDFRE